MAGKKREEDFQGKRNASLKRIRRMYFQASDSN
jgi:hypothetical protein